jgi:hypothetical protein
MKNTLAENLLRFGVKNLSEAEVQKLHEQVKVLPLTIQLPYKKDPTGKWVFEITKPIIVTANFANINTGAGMEYAKDINSILSVELYEGFSVNIDPKYTKKSPSSILMKIYLSANDTKSPDVLGKLKELPPNSGQFAVVLMNNNKKETIPMDGSKYSMYDVNATVPFTPPSKN